MIKVSVFYSNGEGARFDMNYYCEKHMPLVRGFCGAAVKGIAVERGISGGEPGSAPQFLAMGHIYFETVDAYLAAIGPHLNKIMSDVPKYTNVQPMVQISEVKM